MPVMKFLRGLMVALSLVLVTVVHAGDAQPVGDDPVIQARMMRLATVLRCLVCQNQTIADSHADLAVDLRRQITEMMQQGKSDDEVMSFMVQRYGDFVLYRPPVKSTTALLWFGPAALVVLGALAFYRAARQRNLSSAEDEPLTPEQKALADQMLREEEGSA